MTFDLNSLYNFYQNDSNPMEYARLRTSDPVGRIVKAFTDANQDYVDSLAEHRALGDGTFSLDPTRISALEGIMTAALATRATMQAGLEAAVTALGDEEGCTVRYFQVRQRGRDPVEVARLQGIIDALNAIASGCFP